MPLLDAAFVAQRVEAIRSRWAANLDALCTVLPASQEDGSEGAEHELVWPDPFAMGFVAGDYLQFACRIKSAQSPSEGPDSDLERTKAWWLVGHDPAQLVNPTDRLWIQGTYQGGSYTRLIHVVGSEGPRTWEALREVLGWQILPPAVV